MYFRWFLVVVFCALPVRAMAAHECLQLVFPGGSEGDAAFVSYISKTLTDNDICSEVSVMPAKRATRELQLGYVDGEIGRAADYGEVVGDVAVMVPTPGLSHNTYLVTHLPDISRLKQIDYPEFHVGIVRGWVWMQEVAEPLLFANVRSVDRIETLLEMFENKRLDAIFTADQTLDVVKERNPNVSTLKVGKVDIHIWLRKEKAHMVEALDKLMQERNRMYGSFIGPDFEGGLGRR